MKLISTQSQTSQAILA